VHLSLPDDEALTGGFDNGFDPLFSGVDFENPLDLSKESPAAR